MNGKGIHRQDDTTVGHDCWPPTKPASWSPNVRVNGRGVVRKGDTIVPHTCEWGDHEGEIHGGTYVGESSCKVNGRAVQKCGSPIACDNGEEDTADTCAYGGRSGF